MTVLHLPAVTDAAVRRALADGAVTEIKAAGLPLRLRLAACRTRGSWYVVRHARGKSSWRKVATWPALPAKDMLAQLPAVLARLAADDDARIAQLDGPQTLAAVLRWYLERQLQDRQLSPARKSGLRTAIAGHLLPLLDAAGGLLLQGLQPLQFDDACMRALQLRYAPATVRQDFAAARAACRRAVALRLLQADPMAGWTLADFAAAAPQPKEGRLRADHLPALLAAMGAQPAPAQVLLALLLICGTRLGETRQARWAEFDLAGAAPAWNIPAAHTKTRQALRLPLPPLAARLLRAWRQQCTGALLLPAPQCKTKPISHQLASEWVAAASAGKWSAHDLRKLARTCWTDAGTDYFVGELLLNHALKALDATYIHTTAEAKKREALQRWAQQLQPHWPATMLGA